MREPQKPSDHSITSERSIEPPVQGTAGEDSAVLRNGALEPPNGSNDVGEPLKSTAAAMEQSIASARSGLSALGQIFEAYRDYLLTIAREDLSSDLAVKVAPSDLVQETFLQATQDFPRFQGTTSAELKAWLKKILRHNLLDALKRFKGTAKRDLSLEEPIHCVDSDAEIQNLTCHWPSAISILASTDTVQRVLDRLESLPEEQRRVIELRSLQGRSFEEISRELGKSAAAAGKIWARAVEALSFGLSHGESSHQ